MVGKTIQIKVNVSPDERSAIEAAQKAAGYKSLSAYMRDSTLRNESVHLLAIAREIGRLGQIANDLLIQQKADCSTDASDVEATKRAARRIIKACDAVADVVRWR